MPLASIGCGGDDDDNPGTNGSAGNTGNSGNAGNAGGNNAGNAGNAGNPGVVNRTEERFGTEAELKELVDKAHDKGIKVIFDYAMVHVHELSPLYEQHKTDGWFTPKYAVNDLGQYINDAQDPILVDGQPVLASAYAGDPAALPGAVECLCGQNAACGWDGGDPAKNNAKAGERCWFQGYLPHLNYANAEALEYSMSAAIRFAKEIGADGYRLDAVKHIDQAWYTTLRTRLNADPELAAKNFYLVGETYDFGNRDNLKRFINPATMLDGQFDFPLRANLARAVLKRGSGMIDLARFTRENDGYYGCDAVMSPWVGNHDIGRAIHVGEDVPLWDEYSDAKGLIAWKDRPQQPTTASPYERLANAFTVVMTNEGAPLIYYGDEYGLAGAGDPDNRRQFFADDGTYAANEQQLAFNAHIKKLTALRNAHSAFRRGVRTTINASPDAWVFEQKNAEETLYVVINRGDEPKSFCDLPAGAYNELINDGTLANATGDTVPARQARIYQRTGDGTGAPAACTPSPELVRPAPGQPGSACNKLDWLCERPFTFNPTEPDATIEYIELRGDFNGFAGGEQWRFTPPTAPSPNWTFSPDLPYFATINYKFYIKFKEAPNGPGGEAWVLDPDPATQPANPSDPYANSSTTVSSCAVQSCPATPPPGPKCPNPQAGPATEYDWRDAIIYFAFVDRFYNADKANDRPLIPAEDQSKAGDYLGGDYRGVISKIEANYFNDLGVNALWLTVPFDNPDDFKSFADRTKFVEGDAGYYEYTGYHGYWPMDQWPAQGGQ